MPTDDQLLAKILAEPATQTIAESLGLPPEEYAKRVLFYLKNPKAQPQLSVMTPEQENAAGVPSVAESLAFVDKLISGEIPLGNEHEQTRYAGFGEEEKSAVSAAGGRSKTAAQRAPPMPGETTAPPPRKT